MTHTKGFRRNTRKLFRRGFRQHGAIRMKNYLTSYKIGDYVDVVVDGSQHKGMPFKYYHGRTGKVFNVNPRSIGVVVNKLVGNRIIPKRLHVRVEHLRPSQCRAAFVSRIQENDAKKTEANKAGKPISTKRQPGKPQEGYMIGQSEVQFQNPRAFRELF